MERYAHLMDITALSGFSIRLALAIILGFFVGLERQWTKHQAGILTNVIVCVGAYAYTAFSFVIHQDNTDLTRVAAQVVSGTNIRGLSTAATIWTTAAIGILCTLPKVLYAVIVAAAVVVLHLVLHPLSNKINKLRSYDKEKRAKDECMYKISVTCLDNFEVDIRAHLMSALKDARDIILHNLESSETDDGNTKIRAYVSAAKKNDEAIENVLNRIGKDEGILRAGWNIINE
mgnify:CR=1 FL=1